jgi:hypothetical protein
MRWTGIARRPSRSGFQEAAIGRVRKLRLEDIVGEAGAALALGSDELVRVEKRHILDACALREVGGDLQGAGELATVNGLEQVAVVDDEAWAFATSFSQRGARERPN